jgi:sugar lactone lactonase YvrE
MIERVLIGVGALLVLSWGAAQVSTFELPGEEVYPEGIAYDPDGANFFVGSTTDGTILQGDPASGEVTVFSEGGSDGRETALGMDVDEFGRLWVAGGASGKAFVYDIASGDLVTSLDTPEADRTLINDVITTAAGDAYLTDSFRPILFKVSASADGVGELESWLDFTGTDLEYQEGVNLNGIEATEDGRYLIAVQMNTGRLFRIDTGNQEVAEIDLGGDTLERGDGLVLDGQTLYVVFNQSPEGVNVSVVELADDFTSGEVVNDFSDQAIGAAAATGALVDDRLLIVNTQFDRRQAGNPELPFTITSVPVSAVRGGRP